MEQHELPGTDSPANLQSYLDQMEVAYRVSHHPTAYTAQDLAMAEHVSGRKVIKPVIVRADEDFVMCALPACYKVDLDELRNQLQVRAVELAGEDKLRELFPDCELGAEPPIGRLYGMTTLMDESLIRDDHVTFQAGTHEEAVTMSLADYRRIAQPELAHFGRPV
jgi:Ala-tRNA(Pro) deacylase